MPVQRSFLAIIPARGGSQRLPGKNLRLLAGRPLLAYSILTARACPSVRRVVVSSDDDAILTTARQWGAEAIRRPPSLSSATAPTIGAMQHVVATLQGELPPHIALFQCTCPLRRIAEVERTMTEYLASGADSALTVNELHLKAGKRSPEGWFLPQYQVGVRKQDLEPLYQENGALYCTRTDLVRAGTLLGPRTLLLQLPPEAGIASIDYEFDFQLTEALYRQLRYEDEFGTLAAACAA